MYNEQATNKEFELNHDYDLEGDSLFLFVTDDYAYKRSLRLDDDIILDFDENNTPVALEIYSRIQNL